MSTDRRRPPARRAAGAALVLAALPCTAALADDVALDPIVVTATKTATKLSQIPASVTVVTADEIEAMGDVSVGDIIAKTPGVNFYSSGGVGAASFAQLRGLGGEHTLVLIDGVRMNNPGESNQKGAFNFQGLIAHNIERIEIVRGPQATLYGSAASGGVINIITKKGASDGFHGGVKGEYGSYATRRLDGNVSYGGKLDNAMPFTLAYAHSEYIANGPNISDEDRLFTPSETKPSEDDRRIVYDHSLDFRVSPTENLDGRLFLTVNDLSTDLDQSGQDTNYNKDSRTYVYGTSWDARLLDGRLESKNTVSGMRTQDDSWRPSNAEHHYSRYLGQTFTLENQSTYHLSENHSIVAGLAWDQARAEAETQANARTAPRQRIDEKMYHTSGQLQLQSRFFDHLNVVAGMSYDAYSAFDNAVTYRIGAGYEFPETGTTIRAAAGTGYRAPSIAQLYYYENPETLDPEETTLFEAGVDQKLLNDRVKLGVTAFHNRVDNVITSSKDTNCAPGYTGSCYVNGDRLIAKGVETSLGALVYEGESDSLDLQVNYTYTLTSLNATTSAGKITDHAADKISPHVVNVSAIYAFDHDKGSVRADATIKSRGWERYHKGYVAETYDGDGWKLDLAAQYEIMDNVTVYGRVENLFDSEYYTSSGYTSNPFGVYAGIGYTF
ncbi:putative Cobalamin uptake ligand-gated TonB-dependent outer membrane channel [uncultured Alphaproteobacteria bacterium]|uniref:Putative Cobalamin uptake ligand-gated TonB-dependent outer membrane channel n=1 Tax=uncultured Alphaproteobacteria bacterium TaxID=91750 RepID=A0A212ITY4_9PROT|nr:putative Cobalamin uptake ligand-gated TonB-dependent outer membrane channel [uncultured Alphaproteobacteria bacterium]